MIDLIKVFKLVMKILTNIGCRILKVGRVSITRDLHADKGHCYYKRELKPKDFAEDEWHKEDDELVADPKDILNADESILQLNGILHEGFETNLYSEESHASSPLLDIPDSGLDE